MTGQTDLTSNGKPWGWFAADGKTPIATGDDWHKWDCPQAKWSDPFYICEMTGEQMPTDSVKEPCPTKDAGQGREQCTRCGAFFIFPHSPASAALEAEKTVSQPNRTDFSTWKRETLERFARQAADENKQLREDVRAALAAFRHFVKEALK